MSKGLSRFQKEQESALTASAAAHREAWVKDQLSRAGIDPNSQVASTFRGHVSWTGLTGAPEIEEFLRFTSGSTDSQESE